MSSPLKLSSPATHDFWTIPVLWEDEHLLALDKPGCVLASPDRCDPARPNLLKLLHQDIERGATWVRQRRLTYLATPQRLDFETTGVWLLAKSRAVWVSLANGFGNDQPERLYVALTHGSPGEDRFEVAARLGPHPARPGLARVDREHGKRSVSRFEVTERFRGFTRLACRPRTDRTHQIRVHLQHVGLPLIGDDLYGGPPLLLSRLKRDYRPKRHEPERPLIRRAALHLAELRLAHPLTGAELVVVSPWPKDLSVAIRYLRRFAAGDGLTATRTTEEAPAGASDSGSVPIAP